MGEGNGYGCAACNRRYPQSLLKACVDQFDYACRLTTGEIVYFTNATIHGDYCTLDGLNSTIHDRDPQKTLPHPFPRGLDVKLSEIVWCGDAPAGS